MGRLFLLLLVVLGGALYFPETRQRLVDRVQPLAKPLMAPVQVGSTNQELRRIASDLQAYERRNRNLPADNARFLRWMEDRYATVENLTDSWGIYYSIQVWPDSFAIRSAGPDSQEGTLDDLIIARSRISRRDRR